MRGIALVLWFCTAVGAAADKAAFDLQYETSSSVPALAPKAAAPTQGGVPPRFGQLEDEQLEATLTPAGYFTLGTTAGFSSSGLDDGCGITFGHPYALTSYPFFAVDGTWHRLDEFFDPDGLTVESDGDVLRLRAVAPGFFSFEFSLLSGQGGSVQLRYRIHNLDDEPHDFGMGLLFDPALGKWGDGHVAVEGGPLERAAALEGATDLEIWERGNGNRGIGVELNFVGEAPDRVVAANWRAVGRMEEPEADFGEGERLYDLALRAHWDGRPLQPGEEWLNGAVVALEGPEFGGGPFLRWDMPSAFALTNNRMFPREFAVHVEIEAAEAGGQVGGGRERLVLELPSALESDRLEYAFGPAAGRGWSRLDLRSNLVFAPRTVEAAVRLERDGVTVDRLSRRVFLPATPVSETGLTVLVDSVDARNFPFVDVFFRARVDEGERPILDLAAENVAIDEDGRALADFDFGKFVSGGATAADIVFVLDVTSSMADEINAVKDNIVEFADSLSFRRIDFRLALVTFLDEVETVSEFTNDAQIFRRLVAEQFAHGGGDIPENSLEALEVAAGLAFRPEAQRVAVWITDANYHENNRVTSLTRQETIDALLARDVTVSAVGDEFYKSRFYDPFTLATGGSFFDIEGNFRDILLDISRLGSVDRYRLTFRSPAEGSQARQVGLRLAYAGLGGRTTLSYVPPGGSAKTAALAAYPNPFNPQTAFRIQPSGLGEGHLDIFNAVGQRVRRLPVKGAAAAVRWDGRDDGGRPLGAGLYLARLRLQTYQGGVRTARARVLMIK